MDGKIRNKKIKSNISLSLILKIASMSLSFLVIPMTIDYLNTEQYGIWMTLLSVLSWISFLDIGLGNGLRNKLAESLSMDDVKSAKEYISTAYASIICIIIPIFIVLVILIPNINFNKIFNSQTITNSDLIILVIIVLCFFLFNFVLSLSNQLFYALQESALTGLSSLLLNVFLIINILILKQISRESLIYIGISYGISMVTSSMILTVCFFLKHNDLLPDISLIRKNKIKDILGVGIKFFIIQIAGVVIFATDNMIITQVLGPKEVTSYNIAYKLFSIITIGHTIIIAPLWSAYTEAYIKRDIQWIKRLLRKLNLLMIPIIISTFALVLLSNKIFEIWIGDKVIFPQYLIAFMGMYAVISVWDNIYSYFLNGIGMINLQMYAAIVEGVINIPLSILFCKYFHFGNAGVILGTSISLCIFAVIGPLQTHYVLKTIENDSEKIINSWKIK
jgi:O-antigen/teichoic acid export membrane protein